ncbi:MAG: prenyltransferase [Kiritimatiellia bacterium]
MPRAVSHASSLRAWFLLLRPWSYVATLVPFLLAAGLAAGLTAACGCALDWGRWALGLAVGFLFQATVNLLNTWGDERSGVDDVPGAIRTTPQVHDGLVALGAVRAAALGCAAVASLAGVGLCFYPCAGVWRFNGLLLGAGLVGCLGSLNYSTGVKFKYRGLGVPFVSFLMGPLEAFVAFALLLPQEAARLFEPACFVGFVLLTLPNAALVGVVMHGNDMRDIRTDRLAGIVTLASWLGPRRALAYYRICHILPYAVCLGGLLAAWGLSSGAWRFASLAFLLPFLCLPLTVRTLRAASRTYGTCPDNPPWRGLERGSGGVLLVFGVLYSLVFPLVCGVLSR